MLFFIIHFRIFFFYPRLFQVRACVPCVQVATPLHGKMVQRFCVIHETLIFKDLCEQVSVRKLRSSSTFDSFSSMKRTTLNLFIETTNVCWVLAKHFLNFISKPFTRWSPSQLFLSRHATFFPNKRYVTTQKRLRWRLFTGPPPLFFIDEGKSYVLLKHTTHWSIKLSITKSFPLECRHSLRMLVCGGKKHSPLTMVPSKTIFVDN